MMRKQNGAGESDSRKRLSSIFQEEEALSKAFEISNFYTNHRLNIAELKLRLQQFKKTQKPIPNSKSIDAPNLPLISHPEDATNFNASDRNQRDSEPTRPFHKNLLQLYGEESQEQVQPSRQTININTINHPQRILSVDRKEDARQANYRIISEVQKNRYQPKIKTAVGARDKQSSPSSGFVLQRISAKSKKGEKTESSKQSDPSQSRSLSQVRVEGSMEVQSGQRLNELEKQMHHLWQHYQLLTKILLSLREGTRQEKNTIVKYVEDVCSDRFEFVRELLDSIQKGGHCKDSAFLKRLTKVVIQSRLFQNLAVVYVSLEICLQRQPDSHLVNFVGYCCSNVIFLLKLLHVLHSLTPPLRFSPHTEDILGVIAEFEEESYRSRVGRVSDLLLRMEHNNQTIAIVQQRICTRMNRDFQQIIVNFLKNVDLDSKPLLEYAHYIYQFLAFHLARINVVGQFSFVEMAPTPYLSLPKQKTLVVEPWEVLFALKGENTYIRAYSEILLGEVAKHWNIVYWTDLMPEQIDDLLQKLPQGCRLYRYHCRYENDRFLKMLWRIGCDVENTIIVDREESNFKYDREMGIELPWRGKNKDNRLLELLNLLLPFLNNTTTTLRKCFPPLKERMLTEQKKSRQKRRSDIKSSMNDSRNESLLPKNLAGK